MAQARREALEEAALIAEADAKFVPDGRLAARIRALNNGTNED